MKLLVTSALVAAFFSAPVLAQTSVQTPFEGAYLGAGIGQSKLDNDTMDYLDSLGANTDDSDTAYKIFVGYQFNPNFAVEASYLNFGDFTASASNGQDNAELKLGVDGVGAALVGRLPIQNGFSIHGKLGVIAWDGDLSGESSLNGNRTHGTAGEDGTDPFYGLGAEYTVNNIMIRGEYERYDISESNDDYEIDVASVSLGYRF